MATIRITEAELARDVHAVIAKVEQGTEVAIERDNHVVAVLAPAKPGEDSSVKGRLLSECIALAKAYEAKLGYAPTMDDAFARDIQAGIEERRGPFDPPAWD